MLGLTFDAHTLLFASLAVICGFQAILFAVLAKTFAVTQGLMPEDSRLSRFFQILRLERGLMASALAVAIGAGLLLGAVNQWRLAGFGNLDCSHTMRWVIPGVTLTALGAQAVFSSFLVSLLGMKRRWRMPK